MVHEIEKILKVILFHDVITCRMFDLTSWPEALVTKSQPLLTVCIIQLQSDLNPSSAAMCAAVFVTSSRNGSGEEFELSRACANDRFAYLDAFSSIRTSTRVWGEYK